MYTKNEIKGVGLGAGGNKLNVFNTSNAFNHNSLSNPSKNANLISDLDPDAPLRTSKSVSSQDQDFDKVIFKYVFELLRIRKYEEALDICEKTGNWSLKLAISGHNDYIDPEIDVSLNINDSEPFGVENKSLWQFSCRQLSQAQNVDAYEKGIYGVLGGDLDSVLKLSTSWETQFISYLNHLMIFENDAALLASKRINPDLTTTSSTSSSTVNTTQRILNVLANSSNEAVQEQSNHMIRIIIGAIINNTLNLLIEESAFSLQQAMALDEHPELINNRYVIRILIHLIVFLKSINIPVGNEQNTSVLIRTYIEFLKSENEDELVPIYIAYLPEDIAADTYSSLLSTITEEQKRKQHLQLGKKYGLDMENIIRVAVARIFSQTESHYIQQDMTEISESINDSDIQLIEAIHWYTDANMFPDAVHAISAIYRKFLTSGKIGAAKEFGKRIDTSFVVKRYDGVIIGNSIANSSSTPVLSGEERIQVLEYEKLVDCLNTIEQWDNHCYQQQPQQNAKSSKLWRTQALSLVDSISTQVYDLCANWLQNEQITDTPYVQRLRTLYIPFIILELLRVLVSAQDVHLGFLKQAVQLSILVADEKQSLYKLFIGDKLKEFLTIVSLAATDGVVNGEEGIFDV